MLNYKWVKVNDNDYVELRNEDFSKILPIKVPFKELDKNLSDRISEAGIKAFPGSDYYYYLYDKVDSYVTITAPLYKWNTDKGEYVLVKEEHTGQAKSPMQNKWVEETYLKCKEKEREEQSILFERMFQQESIDGISASLLITTNPLISNMYFYEGYVPSDYIKVCEIAQSKVVKEVIFIKKMDAKGEFIQMKTRSLHKGAIIGKDAKNIKKIAKMINAAFIHVV